MRRLALLLAFAFATTSCTNEIDQSTRPENIIGTYTLVTYGGTLPATIPTDSAGTAQVVAGELVVSSDRRWTQSYTISLTRNAGAQTFMTFAEGSWALIREQGYMSFYDLTNKYQFTGTAAGGQITLLTTGGREVVFRR